MVAAGASASSGTGTLLSGASEGHEGHNLVHTAKQAQDMVLGGHNQAFYGLSVFWTAFIT
jgi:hypothetical protein